MFGPKGRDGSVERAGLNKQQSNRLDELTSDDNPGGLDQGALDARKRTVEGIGCQTMIEPIPEFDRAPCETILAGKNNQWIVLGRDRPGNRLTGYGGAGHSHCGSIDLVVGRGSSKANGMFKQAGASDDDVLNPSFFNDAARVYISQKTDPDKNCGLSPGMQGNAKGQSAVIVKADQVRMIGRGGIKIVTGQAKNVEGGPGGEKMASGAKNIRPAPKIELNAGNQNGSSRHFSASKGFFTVNRIQPAVLGENLVEAIQELIELVNQLQGATANFAIQQSILNGVIMTHGHPYHMIPAPTLIAAGITNTIKMITDVHMPIYSQKVNTMFYEMNYLKPFGMHYINSSSIMLST